MGSILRDAAGIARFMLAAALVLIQLTAADEAPIHFRYQPIDFILSNSESENRYAPETMAGGTALFDYDNDGDLDIFFVNGAELPANEKTSPRFHNRLFRNDGSANFEDVTSEAGLEGEGFGFGAAVGDYDNDGHQDLFVAGLHRVLLYRNLGDGAFQDVTERSGITATDNEFGLLWSVAGAWFDYDNDGFLDLFVVNYLSWSPGVDPVCDETGKRDYCHPKHYQGTPNRLYRNNGDGTFEDVSKATGIHKMVGKGMGAATADFDRDGMLDVFVTNDKLPNFLFRNNGAGGFSEVAFETTSALPEDGRDVSGMGLDARDINDDGLVDISYAALPGETFPLLQNHPDGYFEDVTRSSGIASGTRDMAGYSAVIADFDNDGRKDIFFSRGDVQAHAINPAVQVDQWNSVFHQSAGVRFVALTEEAGLDAAPVGRHRGAAVGDLNGDGKLDLVVTALGAPAEIWLNDSPGSSGWLAINLEGAAGNRDGIGAVVRVETQDGIQYNQSTTSVGYASSSAGPVHFGLGSARSVGLIEIRWPSGETQSLEDVAPDQVLQVRQPD